MTQTLIEEFMSPVAAGDGRGKAGSGSKAALPPVPEREAVGRPVLKDFVANEATGEVRPFKGYVKRYFKSDGSYKVRYEDGDEEDLLWCDVWPLIQRAEAAGLPRQLLQGKGKAVTGSAAAAAAVAAAGAKPGGSESGAVRSQQLAPPPAGTQEEGQPPKKRGRPPKQQQAQASAAPAAAAAAAAAATAALPLVAPPPAAAAEAAAPKSSRASSKAAAQKPGKSPKQQKAEAASGQAATEAPKQQQSEPGSTKAAASKPKKQKMQQQGQAAGSKPGDEGAVSSQAAASKPKKQKGQQQQQEQAAGSQGGDEGVGSSKAAAGKKRKKSEAGAEEGKAAAGDGGSKPVKRQRAPQGPAVDFPLPKMGEKHVYEYPRGEEPWRSQPGFKWEVHDELDLSAGAVNRIREVQRRFNKHYIRAEVDENERVEKERAELEARGELGKAGVKQPSRRPDRVAESRFKQEEEKAGGEKMMRVAGHFPGWNVGSRAYCRSELSVMGFHFVPVAGIDFVARGKAGRDAPPFATSVMVSGWYQDDKDEGGEMWYTGEGGNDLLGGRNQVKDQDLKRGNAALVGNIQLGIPVRVTRKQSDSHEHLGAAFTYDGLYDVVSYRYTKGREGKWVYQFLMKRRPGQGALLSQQVTWGGISAKRTLVPANRQGVVVLDMSRGMEPKPVPYVDDSWLDGDHCDSKPHGDIPPFCGWEDVVEEEKLVGKVLRGVNQKRLEQLRAEGRKAQCEYITDFEYSPKALAALPGLKPAVLPPEFEGRPHDYLKQLNHGTLPYSNRGQLFHIFPILYECGPWCKCPLGKDCPQAVSQRGINWRLECFKTKSGCGDGVRSLDTIPQGAFICLYVGVVYEAGEHEELVRTVKEQDARYAMDLTCRDDDTNWDGSEKPLEEQEEIRRSRKIDFVVCGLQKRNIAGTFNHSCAPNCFIQPLLDTHHDTRMPKLGIFAAENITPMTQLTLDYDKNFAAQFPEGCKCGAPDCISRPKAGAAAQAAPGAAMGEQEDVDEGQQQEEQEAGGPAEEGSEDEGMAGSEEEEEEE